MKASTYFLLVALVVCCLTCVVVAAGGRGKRSQQDLMRDACNTCSNIGLSGGGTGTYICAKDKVKSKECNMIIDGFCCSAKRHHKSCKSCKRSDDETFLYLDDKM